MAAGADGGRPLTSGPRLGRLATLVMTSETRRRGRRQAGARIGAGCGLTAVLAALALAGALAPGAAATQGDTVLVSRQSAAAGGDGADSRSFGQSASRSGRFIAFASEATNLGGPIQTGSFQANVFVYDAKKQRVELVSRRSKAAGGLGGNGDSRTTSISDDGRYVAFRTEATNLGGPISANYNVYVYDRKKDRVRLASRQSKQRGGQGADASADNPEISGDGRYVTFNSRATNLSGKVAGGGETNVFVRDLKKRRTMLASRRSAKRGGKGGNGNSFEPALAARKPIVAFQTQARNLGGPVDAAANSNIYTYDWKRKRTTLVSRAAKGGPGGNDGSDLPDLSATGRHVAFMSEATNLGGPIQTAPDDANVYIYDTKKRRPRLVSRQSKADGGQGADGRSQFPSISASGRFVAIATPATNLGGPIVAALNIYAYDSRQKRTTLVSRVSGGGPGADSGSNEPAIAGTGRFVTFISTATNLDPAAYTGGFPTPTSVYRFQLRP